MPRVPRLLGGLPLVAYVFVYGCQGYEDEASLVQTQVRVARDSDARLDLDEEGEGNDGRLARTLQAAAARWEAAAASLSKASLKPEGIVDTLEMHAWGDDGDRHEELGEEGGHEAAPRSLVNSGASAEGNGRAEVIEAVAMADAADAAEESASTDAESAEAEGASRWAHDVPWTQQLQGELRKFRGGGDLVHRFVHELTDAEHKLKDLAGGVHLLGSSGSSRVELMQEADLVPAMRAQETVEKTLLSTE